MSLRLFHDLQNFCNFEPAYWQAYKQVNERYADGVLILSQFAGAAEQLKPDALLVNPYDVEQLADTLLRAFQMSPGRAQSANEAHETRDA